MKTKLFTLFFALMASINLWAIGRNDGSTIANAIDYDWDNGVQQSSGTKWYHLDLAPLYYGADSLRFYITNPSNTEAVNVVCKTSILLQDVGVTFMDSIIQTLAPQTTYDGWMLRRELFVTEQIIEIFFTVSTTGAVKLSWQALYPSGDSCEDPLHGGCQEAGTKWHILESPDMEEREYVDSLVIHFENTDANYNYNDISNTISLSFRADCESPEFYSQTFTIEPYDENTIAFSAEMLAALGWPNMVLSCTSSSPCCVFYGYHTTVPPTPGESCDNTLDITWEPVEQQADMERWYLFNTHDGTFNPIIPDTCDMRFVITNTSDETANVNADVYFDCREEERISQKSYMLEPYGSEYLDIDRGFLERFGWPSMIYNVTSDQNISIKAELIPDSIRPPLIPCDYTIWYNENIYLDNGDSYYWQEADTVIYNSGTYQHTFTTNLGCDSIVTLNITFGCPFSGDCGNNLVWTLSCDSVLTISGTGAMWDYSYNSAPWYFSRTSIISVIISEGVTSIGYCSFQGCHSLTSVVIPNSVTNIGNYAFANCRSLTSVEIPNRVTKIGRFAFQDCRSLTSVEIPNNVTSISDFAFADCTNLTSVTIPNSVISIKSGAFESCSSLTSVEIPNSVTSIGHYAFNWCTSLISIEIPNSVISIGDGVFATGYNLSSINVDATNPNYCSENGVLFNKDKSALVQYPGGKQGAYIIPGSVTSIKKNALSGCRSLTSVVIPNSVTNIEPCAFSECSDLMSITNYADTPQPIVTDVYRSVDISSCTLYVPAGSVAAYQAADVWKEFGNILPIEGSEEPGNLCDAPTELRVANMYNNNAGTVSLSWNGTAASYEVKAYSYELDQWYGPKIVNGTQTSFNNMPFGLTDFYVRAICGENEYSSEAIATKLLYYSDLMAVDYLDLDNAICYVNNSTPTDTRTFNDFRQVPAVNYGPSDINSRHTIHYDRNETDLRTGGMAKTVPDGELASVRLGNWDSGAQAERIEFSFTIDTLTSPVLLLKYLPIFEAPEHDASANPRIKVDLLINGQSLGRGYQLDINANDVYTGSQLKPSAWADGWHITSASVAQTAGDIVWKEWTTVGFNLRSPMYQGRTITVRITTFDCTFSAHCGYVYFTIRGSNGQFKGMKCGQINPELEAPDGFNYRWMYASNEQYRRPNGSVPEQYILSRDQIYNAGMQDDSLYVVDCMFAQDSSRFFSLYATPLAAEPIAQMNEPQIARNEQDGSYTVLFDASLSQVQEIDHVIGDTLVSRNSNIDSYEWNIAGIPNGWSDEVSPTFTFPGDGTYEVTLRVTSGGCESMLHYNLQLQPETPEPCLIASGTCGANLTWELSCDSVLTISGTGAMVDNPSWSPYVSLIKAVIIPEGLTIIGRNAFAECVNLESAHIPESVTAIGPAAFYNCSALTSINMPDSVRMLGHKAFVGCESLTEPVYNAHIFGFMPRNYCGAYSIPEGIVSVAAYAFCGIASATCSGLTEITIPSSVKRLGVEAFGLLFLRKITCLAVTPPTCDSTTFEWYLEETGITVKVDRSIPVYVPAESVDAYKAADVWKEFFNILPIGGTIEPQDSIYDVVYLDQAGLQIETEPIILHLPVAPEIEGFTFLKWQVVAGDLENGIYIQAVYTANESTNAPEVYTNPANKAQKLIRNGKVYILTDDKVYSISGQKVK